MCFKWETELVTFGLFLFLLFSKFIEGDPHHEIWVCWGLRHNLLYLLGGLYEYWIFHMPLLLGLLMLLEGAVLKLELLSGQVLLLSQALE